MILQQKIIYGANTRLPFSLTVIFSFAASLVFSSEDCKLAWDKSHMQILYFYDSCAVLSKIAGWSFCNVVPAASTGSKKRHGV